MAVESIFYSVSSISCRGALIWEEGVKASRPLLLMAPNWRGVIKPAIEAGQMLAAEGYVVFVADMFGEGNGPVGTENPMEFLRPFMSDVPGMRRRIAAALDTLTREADRRAIGDITRRAAMGFCFGGLNVLDLARTGADVQAVVSMHGTLTTPQPANKGDIKAAVLAVHGAADPLGLRGGNDFGRRTLGVAHVRRCGPCLYRSASQPSGRGDVQRARHPAWLRARACLHRRCFRREAVRLPRAYPAR